MRIKPQSMKKLMSLLIACGFAFGGQIEIKVKLNPAGSFSAKSEALNIEGDLQVAGDGFRAKKIALLLETLETGLSLRNEHMKKKYFEVALYPKAVLLEAVGSQGKFKGKLIVHGVEKAIEGQYRVREGMLETEFSCRLSDFKIKEANYMGVGVEDEVSIHASLPIK